MSKKNMVRVKVRLKNYFFLELFDVCRYVHKSRSYLCVLGFSKIMKDLKHDFLLPRLRGIKSLTLSHDSTATTICLPLSVYVAVCKLKDQTGFSINVILNFCLDYIVHLIKVSKVFRDYVISKNEKWDSEVKKNYAWTTSTKFYLKLVKGGVNNT